MSADCELPRLLYIGDVPVESSYHGSQLLFRLLQTYPRERLRIIEAGVQTSQLDRRLPGVEYTTALQPHRRWLNTRWNRWIAAFLTLRASLRLMSISHAVGSFTPEAVLTVAHGFSWMTAAAYARRNLLPLHFIVHDDWPRVIGSWPVVRKWVDRQFAHCYRDASSRLCVSQFMVQEYQQRYGSLGTALYPTRSQDCVSFSNTPSQVYTPKSNLLGVYAGSINSSGFAKLIGSLAEALDAHGGKLMIFGPHTSESLSDWGLSRANILNQGLVPSTELIFRCRREGDFLFVPMSFDGVGHMENMRLSFPSKFTDYTVVGLPLLICGPDYCSAVRWAYENRPLAEVITSNSAEAIAASVLRMHDTSYRALLGQRALDVGNAFFSHAVGQKIFIAALSDRKK
jgi:hypothetical protein